MVRESLTSEILINMKANKIYIYVVILISFACATTSKTVKSEKELSFLNTQYYRLFTDATKNALFGNNKAAISMYNACIAQFPDRAAPYYQLSSIYLKENNIEKAREYALIAKNLDDSNIWYKAHLANIYQYENNLDSAAVLYEEILKEKNDLDTKYNLALLYSQMKNNERAMELLDELDNEIKGSRSLFLMRHNVYHNMGEYDSAIVVLESLIKYFPDDVSNYGILAEYLAEVGKNGYASEVYLDLLRQDSLNGLALLSYGDFFMINNKPDSAFIYYRKAVCCSNLDFEGKISLIINFISNKKILEKYAENILQLLDIIKKADKDFRVYASYTDIYINIQEYEKAVPYFDTALFYEKNNLMLWEQAILVNNYLRNYEKVIDITGNAVEYFPDQANILVIRAYSEHELKLDKEAVNDISKALELKPETELKIQSYNLLAEIYRNQQLDSKSDSCFELILEIDSENLMIRNNYSYYLSLRDEKLDYALELSKLTIEMEPANATYLDTYGWILFKMGEYKEAKKYIELAIRNGAYNNSEVLDHYGDIMLKLGNCREAIEAWETIVELNSEYDIAEKLKTIKEDCK